MAAALNSIQHPVKLCSGGQSVSGRINTTCRLLRLDALSAGLTASREAIWTRSIRSAKQQAGVRTAASFSSDYCSSPQTNPCNLCVRSQKVLQLLESASSFQQFAGGRGLNGSRNNGRSTRRLCVAMAGGTENDVKPRKVLFVCLGNICRSPTAEAVFRAAVEKRGLSDEFEIDSAGTIDYHQGDPADWRMMKHAAKRGVKLTSISRPIVRSDFEKFDLILAMDENNQRDLNKAIDKWSSQRPLPESARSKVRLMCSYCRKFDDKEVPDPYYGGSEGFEKVLDLLEDACDGLLDSLVA